MFLHKNPREGGINSCLINDLTKYLNTENEGNQDGGVSGAPRSMADEPSVVDESIVDEATIVLGPLRARWAITTPLISLTSCLTFE